MKKIGLLCLALVLALGTLGIGYATWSDNVTVEEQIFSGELCAGFVPLCTVSDDPGSLDTMLIGELCGTYEWDLVTEAKDIGSGNCTFQDLNADGHNETLVVTINNTYPSYYTHVDVWLRNCGTIPWMVQKVELLDGNDQLLDTMYGADCNTVDLGGTTDPDIEIKWGNGYGIQVEPYPTPDYEINLSWGIHLLQEAPDRRW